MILTTPTLSYGGGNLAELTITIKKISELNAHRSSPCVIQHALSNHNFARAKQSSCWILMMVILMGMALKQCGSAHGLSLY